MIAATPGRMTAAFSAAIAASVLPRYSSWSKPTGVIAIVSARAAVVESSRPPSPVSRIASRTFAARKATSAVAVSCSKNVGNAPDLVLMRSAAERTSPIAQLPSDEASKLLAPARALEEAPPAALVRMKVVATALLVVMAGVFLGSRPLTGIHPAWGFVRAFAEAAMVGGLADWFAVTALFRHPLGLPIPHTAIIPRNKDRIGDQLAQFLREYFLIPAVVARRMQRIDVAAAAGRWLANPRGAGGSRLTRGISRLATEVLQALDQERLGGMVRAMMVTRVRETELSPMLGRALAAAMAEERHRPVIDALVRWMRGALASKS